MTWTVLVAPWGIRSVGPGTEPLYANIRTVASPICFLTGRISRSKSSPSASSTSSVLRICGRPRVSRGNSMVWLSPSVLGSGIVSILSGRRLRQVPGAHRCAFRLPFRSLELCDPRGDVPGIILHPADQRRSTRVLPRKAEEEEARDTGDATTVAYAPALLEDGQLDPRMVGAIARRPDDRVDLELSPVREANRSPVGADDASLQVDPVPLPELAWTRADQRVTSPQLPAEASVDRLVEKSRLREP